MSLLLITEVSVYYSSGSQLLYCNKCTGVSQSDALEASKFLWLFGFQVQSNHDFGKKTER